MGSMSLGAARYDFKNDEHVSHLKYVWSALFLYAPDVELLVDLIDERRACCIAPSRW